MTPSSPLEAASQQPSPPPIARLLPQFNSAQRRVGTETDDITVTSIDICSVSKQPAVFSGLLYFGAIDMTVERQTRGSLLDPADSNNGPNDPENDGGSFSETTTAPLSKGVPQNDLRNDPARFGQTTPKTTRDPFWETGAPAHEMSLRDEPENDLAADFENTRGRFGRVVSTKRPRGSFHNDPLAR